MSLTMPSKPGMPKKLANSGANGASASSSFWENALLRSTQAGVVALAAAAAPVAATAGASWARAGPSRARDRARQIRRRFTADSQYQSREPSLGAGQAFFKAQRTSLDPGSDPRLCPPGQTLYSDRGGYSV